MVLSFSLLSEIYRIIPCAHFIAQSPAKNILIENIYCNWSGGCAMGSLGADTAISDIHYRNVYTWASNQMYMVKSNGGSGTVSNVVLENFIGASDAHPSFAVGRRY